MPQTIEQTPIPPELMAELQATADRLAKGIRDVSEAKKAAQRMDQVREENRRILGIRNIGVDVIWQMRDSRLSMW